VLKGGLDSPLVLFNRNKEVALTFQENLPHNSSIVASTIAETVLNSSIIFVCVSDDAAVLEIITTALLGSVRGKLFVDCSTIHPDTTTTLTKLITQAGAEFVACPVFGVPAVAEAGQLLCVLAGPSAAVDKIRPYTVGVMSRANIDLSDQDQAKGTHLKIVGNTFLITMLENLSEGHVLAEKSGLGVDNLHKFLELMFPGPYTTYSKRLITGDYYSRAAVSRTSLIHENS
jgi:3-hydroxyisobutyrate dehydrogenase-like beta-hydroxyacid dehydrogenase